MSAIKVLSWNTRGYTGSTKNDQLEVITDDLRPDILALQEVVRGSLEFWRASLEAHGYSVVTSAIELLDRPGPYLPHKTKRVDQPTDAARILCGDFNSPWSESDESFVVGGGRSDAAEEARWQRAELGFLKHPELRDVYRHRHQAGEPFAVSHWRGRGVNRTGCRYDHICASATAFDLDGSQCLYREDLLESGLSDHAPVLATIKLR